MRISTKGRYGLRVMIELAARNGTRPVLLKDIARGTGVSVKYLHRILTTLRASGLVRSVRGAGGGYLLARPAKGITVSEIVQRMEGPFYPVECLQDPSACQRAPRCVARGVWQVLGEAIEHALDRINLEDLARSQKSLAPIAATFDI